MSGCEFWSVLVALGTSVSSHISSSHPVSICTCSSYWGELSILNVAVYFPRSCRQCVGFVSYCLLSWRYLTGSGPTGSWSPAAPLAERLHVFSRSVFLCNWLLCVVGFGAPGLCPHSAVLNSSLCLLLVELPSALGCKYVWVSMCPSFAYMQISFGYKSGFVFLLGHLYSGWGLLPHLETWAVPGMELLLNLMGKSFGFLFCGLKRFSLIFSTLFKLRAANSVEKVLSEVWQQGRDYIV